MELNYRDLVRVIDEDKHRRTRRPLPAQRPRTRQALARGLHRLADRIAG